MATAAATYASWEYTCKKIYAGISSRSLGVQVQYSGTQAVFVSVVACFSHLDERYKGVLLSFAEILLEHHFRHLGVIPTVDKRKERGRNRPRYQAWLKTVPKLLDVSECNTQPPAAAVTGGYGDMKGDD